MRLNDHFSMLPEMAFRSLGGRMTLEGGGKGSAPPPPDYAGAARETAAGNREAAIAAQEGNMINQYTPQGSVVYSQHGTSSSGTPLWSQTVTMSPQEQQAYNENMAMNARLRGVAGQGVGYVQSALNQPLSYEGLQRVGTPGEIQRQASDAAYQNAMRYVEPRLERQQASLENQLANQGITRGSEAWNAAMADAEANRENIYSQAQNAAYTAGLTGANQAYNQAMGARQQGISERNYLRQEPINILNAVRTGSQLQSSQQPQVGVSSPGQLATWSGPDLLGAATAQGQYNQGLYNAQQAGSSNTTSGLMGLAGTAAMAGATAY